jgi:hypothetical protein
VLNHLGLTSLVYGRYIRQFLMYMRSLDKVVVIWSFLDLISDDYNSMFKLLLTLGVSSLKYLLVTVGL